MALVNPSSDSALALALLAVLGCQPPADPGSTSERTSSDSSNGESGPSPDLPPDAESSDESESSDSGPPPNKLDTIPDWVCDPDPAAMDCPAGERCRPCAQDGSPACQDVAEAPAAKGEACTITQAQDTIQDDCDAGLMCADYDGLGTFTCVELCSGTTLEPTCSSPDEACADTVSMGCWADLCRLACDPIAQDCPAAQACFVDPESFGETPVCVPPWTWEGELGEPCSTHTLGSCAPGLLCGDGPVLGCVPTGFFGCCTPLCDLDQQDCASIEDGLTCQPFDPGYEPLGICAFP